MLTDAIVHHINLLTRLELIMSKKIKSKIKLVNCVVSDIESDVPHIICDFVYRGAQVSRLFELPNITFFNASIDEETPMYAASRLFLDK